MVNLPAGWNRLVTVLVIWGLLVAGGFYALAKHQLTAGESGIAPKHWPAASQLRAAPQGYTLVVFAHPKCPCFRSSAEALKRMVTGQPTLHCVVVAAHPARQREEWCADFWEFISETIPQAAFEDDLDLRETKLFGARTSGEAMLFDQTGTLCFHGGLTPLRGHSGYGGGEPLIAAVLAGHPSERTAKVFGCSLGLSPEGTR